MEKIERDGAARRRKLNNHSCREILAGVTQEGQYQLEHWCIPVVKTET